MQTGYEPLETLKPAAEGLWLIDGPAVVRRRLAVPVRTTVVQLAAGGLWVHAPCGLTQAAQAQIATLGDIACLIGPEGQDTGAPPAASELERIEIEGAKAVTEVAYFHHATYTLILDQLIVNLETAKLPVWMRPLIWFAGTDDPNGTMPSHLRRTYKDKDALGRSIEALIALRPRRIVLSHGRWYSNNAIVQLERAFSKILRERMWMKAVEDIKARES